MMKTWSILIEFIYDNKYIKSRRGLSEAAFLPLWEHFQFIFIIISAAAAILDQCVGHLAPPVASPVTSRRRRRQLGAWWRT